MQDIPLDKVSFDNLAALKDAGRAEDRHLDFKLELPGSSDSDKKEFLADICSFANAGGGDIIYGVEEAKDSQGKNTGTIAALPGLTGLNFDQARSRLESQIRDGLDPRVPTVRFRSVEGGSEGPFLVIRIGRSFVGPHLVKYQSLGRFYSRHSAGKFQLDVREIRAAFLDSAQGIHRARNFRLERIAKIMADETPGLIPGGRWVLHILPVSMTWSTDIDPQQVAAQRVFSPIITPSEHCYMPNLDGLVALSQTDNAIDTSSYSLLFRDGAIEAVDSFLLNNYSPLPDGLQDLLKIIPSTIEQLAYENIKNYVELLRRIGVAVPLAISMSFINALGYRMELTDWREYEHRGFDRSEVLLPEILLEPEKDVTPEFLRPMFDVLWQSAGLWQSRNYTSDGKWKLLEQH